MNYFSKVEYTIGFIIGEVPNLPEDFEVVIAKGEGENVIISADDGQFILLDIDLIEASESDAQYYDLIRDFVKLYQTEPNEDEPVIQDSN